jgi:hypothetical protein
MANQRCTDCRGPASSLTSRRSARRSVSDTASPAGTAYGSIRWVSADQGSTSGRAGEQAMKSRSMPEPNHSTPSAAAKHAGAHDASALDDAEPEHETDAPGAVSARLAQSPRLSRQRQLIAATFGPAAQRSGHQDGRGPADRQCAGRNQRTADRLLGGFRGPRDPEPAE